MTRIGVLVLIASSLVAPAQKPSLIGKPAPEFARRDLHGQAISLRNLHGKVVLLNFWATWCAPCQEEMPVFNAWQRTYSQQGLAVIGISMDDDARTARRLVDKLGLVYPIAMGDARLGKRYGKILGLPKTFLIGRDGVVIALFEGETDLKTVEVRVQAALTKK